MQSNYQYFVLPNQSVDDIPDDIHHLHFCGYNNQDLKSITFTNNSFSLLQSLSIRSGSFKNVREFVIDGLESLESVKICDKCLKFSNNEYDGKLCRITNCSNLRQLEIGDYSFFDFKLFELSNLNSLQSIKSGWYCFRYSEGFSLKGK